MIHYIDFHDYKPPNEIIEAINAKFEEDNIRHMLYEKEEKFRIKK